MFAHGPAWEGDRRMGEKGKEPGEALKKPTILRETEGHSGGKKWEGQTVLYRPRRKRRAKKAD